MAWTIRDPRFEIEQINWRSRAEQENLEAAGGFRSQVPSPQDEAANLLEASVYGWRLYNADQTVAWSLGRMFLSDCEAMVDWLSGRLDLQVTEMWDWKSDDRVTSTTKEWVPVEPFFEIHLSRPSVYRKTPTAQWLLVNGGEWVAASDPDLYGHECRDFLAWIQDEMDVPITSLNH